MAKMQFMKGWTIDLEKIPNYPDLNHDFMEKIDFALGEMILNYEGDARLTPEMKSEFAKTLERVDKETNMLAVKYSPRFKIGRRYPDCSNETYPNGQPNKAYGKYWSALISHPRIIKNTIFEYQDWVDIDQRKGHPTIISS